MRNIRIPQVFTLIHFMYTNVTATTPVTFFLHLNKFFGGNKKEKGWIHIPTFSSLLSDSNQRPRDYKSRALAN